MAEISRFSDSDGDGDCIVDGFEAMSLESDFETSSDRSVPSSQEALADDSLWRTTICKHFIQYYNLEYRREFPERCVQGATNPWHGMHSDADLVDELFHRITCYIDTRLQARYDHTHRDHPDRFRITKEILVNWMDILVQRTLLECKAAGHAAGCIISSDPWSGDSSLYKRLDDWIELKAVEHALYDCSVPWRCHNSPVADDGHQTVDDNYETAASDHSSDSDDSDDSDDIFF
ncbi:hypothetical protein EX895_000045 [Sporisorium graminicola]|uniref:Uncharacterized protein n=1 Tax=Sporisorium graminicola TaxID=280036 RepID=A0A4U7L073_9BASI|nr:hypothetical protein EX895_000045 [Sporisorium graminicola]TKY90047.1 hypothetical protein EX895_000045 [Sporisorium graminicola]